MTNTQLDQLVAGLLGWRYSALVGAWYPPDLAPQSNVLGHVLPTPSTNLAQAMGLWDERRPCNAPFEIQFAKSGNWIVWGSDDVGKVVPYADLPRAITEAWVQAKEAV